MSRKTPRLAGLEIKHKRRSIKTGERSIAVSLRMTREQREKLAALGGAAWVRVKIDEEGKK